ncbi:B3 domain-containing protein At2g33720-like [Gastrolobium bilobum]|uniref:B3 domain-containing protein At2g33720-like n=2 Tax=Gastrolobium bilobum TaxID=150636 RepID=UPI002AAF106C|nr:B3 domain-containing protein At2g33720-like [Gastrolobium bilobum]XP_061348952.1 B3 domain-containing protein At2g33720-like [Gastrolobium bilobum]XP_061366405.1 B3 domain-containing protein At2g33720-like [Gastrolobium bilobum]XP_061369128.1 B3 domain-containing protein At2g33720-like [Gastrolobium bilobum]XP_061371645.1 B3 domain-containing protein At2g33720-like [Gastrolobium bilobum]
MKEMSATAYDTDDVSVSLTKKRKIYEETHVAARKKVCVERSWGYSLDLMLYDDPWKIKKVLNGSDLGNMRRLLLPKDFAENLVVPVLDGDVERGVQVDIWDVDTASIHSLIFKKWVSSRSYVFIGNWVKDFVSRRGLKKGDEIGLHWDPYKNRFNFSVLDAF